MKNPYQSFLDFFHFLFFRIGFWYFILIVYLPFVFMLALSIFFINTPWVLNMFKAPGFKNYETFGLKNLFVGTVLSFILYLVLKKKREVEKSKILILTMKIVFKLLAVAIAYWVVWEISIRGYSETESRNPMIYGEDHKFQLK